MTPASIAGPRHATLREMLGGLLDQVAVFPGEDGGFVLPDGSVGNPGCDECGGDDAVVRLGGLYLCDSALTGRVLEAVRSGRA